MVIGNKKNVDILFELGKLKKDQSNNVAVYFFHRNLDKQLILETIPLYIPEGIGCLKLSVHWEVNTRVFLCSSKTFNRKSASLRQTANVQSFLLDCSEGQKKAKIRYLKSQESDSNLPVSIPYNKIVNISGKMFNSFYTIEKVDKIFTARTYSFDVKD